MINISVEDVINELNAPKVERERLYLKMCNLNSEDGEVVWDGDKITGFHLYQALEYITLTVQIPPTE